MKIKFKGKPIHLAGKFVQKGEKAPDFTLISADLTEYKLNDWKGKYLILNIFPSLDTSVCATSVRKFNKVASEFPETAILCISKDLPFAQKRFCSTEGLNNVTPLSDYCYTSNFGSEYGVLMTDGPLKGLLARAIIIIDQTGTIIYSQLVDEVTHEPDYNEALNTIK